MDNNTKFTVAVDKLNRMITMLNIKISEEPENIDLRNELKELIDDKDLLFKGNVEDLENIIKKYGDRT